MSILSFWSWSRLCVPCYLWSCISFLNTQNPFWLFFFLFFSLQPMIWTAVLVSLNLVCILCNHSHNPRFLCKIPNFGLVMFKLLIHLLEHDCWCCSLKLWIVQLWNYLQLTLILLCGNFRRAWWTVLYPYTGLRSASYVLVCGLVLKIPRHPQA